MNLRFQRFELQLSRRWTISSGLGPGGGEGANIFNIVLVELRDKNGVFGFGEAAPSSRYREDAEGCARFFQQTDPSRLSFVDVPASMAYLESLGTGFHAAKGALNMALIDGAARLKGQAVHDWFGLDFRDGLHTTSFSIGLDVPALIREKTAEAAPYPILKLKVGSSNDRENLAALRDAAPDKTVRVDANEAWTSKEEALRQIEWFAANHRIELVEQPMPAALPASDHAWLRARSPLPLMADESYRSAADAASVAECFHAVNVKLVKMGGLQASHDALIAARNAGLKTMLGCMIESSVLITAAAHLAALTDYLDLDGNLLVNNDPFEGVGAPNGRLCLGPAVEPLGLRVRPRPDSSCSRFFSGNGSTHGS